MDVHVASSAEWNTLASACDHDFHPERFFPVTFLVQVCQFTHVMHLHILLRSAYVTRIVEESFQYLRAHLYVRMYDLIFDRGILPCHCEPTKRGHERRVALRGMMSFRHLRGPWSVCVVVCS